MQQALHPRRRSCDHSTFAAGWAWAHPGRL